MNNPLGLSENTIEFLRYALCVGLCIHWIIKHFIFLQITHFEIVVDSQKAQLCLSYKRLELQRGFCQSSYLNSLQEHKKRRCVQFRKYFISPNRHSEIISLSFICTNDPLVAYGHPCVALGQFSCQRKTLSSSNTIAAVPSGCFERFHIEVFS